MPDRTYSAAEIDQRLSGNLAAWSFADGTIRRSFHTHNWKATMMAANAVAHLAEAAWHHPDLELSFDTVTVKLSSHDAKGITDRDFALAEKIEQVVAWTPGDEIGSPLSGPPSDPRFAYLKKD